MTAEDHIHNDSKQIAIRKCQSNLIIVGTGVIALAVWDAIKTVLLLVILRNETVDNIKRSAEADAEGVSNTALFVVVCFFTLIVLLIVVTARLYIGRSSISEGRGGRGRRGYLFLACVSIVFSTISIFSDISIYVNDQIPQEYGALSNDVSLPAIIIEVTSMIMMLEMVVSAIRIRKLRGMQKHAKGA